MSACDETLPATMGRYQIVRRIPGGGMTEVYLVRVSGSFGIDRPLVLKALPKVHGSEAEARFLEEAAISLSLSHGNITATFETGRTEDGRAFLVMEYVHGSSLREILDHGPLPAPLAIFVAREIARALRYTHTFADLQGRAAPIVHLDVTPENVLVSRAGHVKLTDFGIARAVGQSAGETVFGKPAYTAPEILARQDGGPASDLFSLGCVLYEMMTGRAPHRGADRDETIANVRAGLAPPPPSPGCDLPEPVGEEVDRLVSSLLDPDHQTRMADAALVERILTGALTRVEPLPTEADLSALMEARFPASTDSGLRHRLRAELQAAGRTISGAEDTDSLLQERTIPLPAAEALQFPPEEGRGERLPLPARGAKRAGTIFLLAVLAALFLLFMLSGPLSFTPPEEQASPAQTFTDSPVPPADSIVDDAHPPPPGEDERLAHLEQEASIARGELALVGAPRDGAAAIGSVTPSTPTRPGQAQAEPRGTASGPDGFEEPVSLEEAVEPDGADQADASVPDDAAPAPRPASLQINAYPYARVVLGDDVELGTTPLRDVRLPAGVHRLRFFNPELGLEREMEIDLAEGEERVLGVRLDR